MQSKSLVSFDLKDALLFIDKAQLNERQRRMFYGFLSSSIGYGGKAAVTRCLGISPHTADKALKEFKGTQDHPVGRIRRPGAGRKKITISQEGLASFIENQIASNSYSNPKTPLRWTTLSLRELAELARKNGFKVSHVSIGNILEELGYSKQANQKMLQVGNAHPNRDDQFKFISETTTQYLDKGLPVISIDCKKNQTIEELRKYTKVKCNSNTTIALDSLVQKLSDLSPNNIFVLNSSTAFIHLDSDLDTASLMAQSVLDWWYLIGRKNFVNAKRLLITCEGSSYKYENRLWKFSLACLAEATGLEIQVSHFPPGTSKWNGIEHRLFGYTTKNRKGKSLFDIEVVVNLISPTAYSGIEIQSQVERNLYKTGKNIAEEQKVELDIEPVGEFGQWNYIVKGFKKDSK